LHRHSQADSLVLIQQELRYAASYITSREYAETVFTAPKHDRLLNFNITFFTYYDLQHLFYEIFVREIYAFKAQTSTPFIIDCGSNIGMSILYF